MAFPSLNMDTDSENVTMNVTPPAGFGGPIAVPEGCEIFPLSIYDPRENSKGPITYDILLLARDITYGVMAPLFVILAVPLNIINMVVFYRQGIKERINLCLFVLSLDDLLVVVFIFEVKMDWFLALYGENRWLRDLTVLKANLDYMVHSTYAFNHISRFMALLISLERCLCVVSPLKARTMFNLRTTAIIISISHVVIYAICFVFTLKFKVLCLYDPFTGEKKTEFLYSKFYRENKTFVDNYDLYLLGLLMIGGMDIGVIAASVVTLLKMGQMKETREKLSSNVCRQDTSSLSLSLTRMLIANNVFFVICTTPHLTYHFIILFMPEFNEVNAGYINANSLVIICTDVFALCNSTASFVLYMIFGTRFRRNVKQLFSRS